MQHPLLTGTVFWLGVSISIAHGQAAPPDFQQGRRFYVGLEGIIFANRPTQFTQTAPYLEPADQDLAPRPALVVGCRATPRLDVELHVQDLPVLTGYSYQRELANTYLGFGQSYTQDYLYLPVQAVWRVTGTRSRFGLHVVAGGGPAWTDTSESLITPTGTQVFTSSGSGSIGVGPVAGPGATTATVTQYLARQQGFFMGLEAGLRGTWQVRPRLGLALTVRQLWATTASARDLQVTISTDNQLIATTMQTPVRGICTGLGVHYSL